MTVVGGVLTDHIDNGAPRAPRVVEIGGAVAEAGSQMKQGQRGFVHHPAIAIGCASDDPFKQPEYGSHAGLFIDCGDQLHLGCARVGKTHVDTCICKRCNQGLCTVHGS